MVVSSGATRTSSAPTTRLWHQETNRARVTVPPVTDDDEWRSQGRRGGDFTLKVAETGVPPRPEALGVAIST